MNIEKWLILPCVPPILLNSGKTGAQRPVSPIYCCYLFPWQLKRIIKNMNFISLEHPEGVEVLVPAGVLNLNNRSANTTWLLAPIPLHNNPPLALLFPERTPRVSSINLLFCIYMCRYVLIIQSFNDWERNLLKRKSSGNKAIVKNQST